jgi:hypothetical protein
MLTAEVFESITGGYAVRIAQTNGSRALFSYHHAQSAADAVRICKESVKFRRSYSGAIFCEEMETGLNQRTAESIAAEIVRI